MKKLILITTIFTLIYGSTEAQKLKDKLNKASGKEESETSSGTATGTTGNQFTEAQKFIAGEKRVYFDKNADGDWIQDMTRKNNTELMITSFKKDNSGNVIEVQSMVPDDMTSPLYYKHPHYANKDCAIFLNGYLYFCNVEMPAGTVSNIYRIYGTQKVGLTTKLKDSELIQLLTDYIKNNRSNYDSKILAGEEARKKAIEEKKAVESVEGLEVTSIKLIPGDNAKDIKYNGTIGFSVEATIKDGTKRTTTSGSEYMSAYTFTIDGVNSKVLSAGSVSLGYNYVTNDQLTITATLKSNPKVTAKATLNVLPDAVVFSGDKFTFGTVNELGGSWWNKMPDTRVEIKKVKSTTTGEDLIAYKIFYGSDSEPKYAFKVKATEYVKVHADASNSTTSDNVSVSDKGYDAGNIKVIMDPSVPKGINFTTSANGGTKKGKNGVTSSKGADGKIETITEKVSW